MTTRVTLYTTAICHLCEEAEALLRPLEEQGMLALEKVDIVDDESLLEVYRTRIPVLKFSSGVELNWPFSFQDVCGVLMSERASE